MTTTRWMQEAERRQYVNIGKRRDVADACCGHNPKGRGEMGAFCRRHPLQYRHIGFASLLASIAFWS